jgi:hypothetical protein
MEIILYLASLVHVHIPRLSVYDLVSALFWVGLARVQVRPDNGEMLTVKVKVILTL